LATREVRERETHSPAGEDAHPTRDRECPAVSLRKAVARGAYRRSIAMKLRKGETG